MRTPRMAVAGLILLLVGGLAFAGQWFVKTSAPENSPRACVGMHADEPQDNGRPTLKDKFVGPPVTSPHDAYAPQPDAQLTSPSPAPEVPQASPDDKPEVAPKKDVSDPDALRKEIEKLLEEAQEMQPLAEVDDTINFGFTVSGRVVDDQGAGVAGAAVSGYATYYSPRSVSGDSDGVRRRVAAQVVQAGVVATCDGAGYFAAQFNIKVARGVSSVTVILSAAAERYVQKSEVIRLNDVKEGDARQDVAITMYAAGILSGRVVDERGYPLFGVQVQATLVPTESRNSRERSRRPTAVAAPAAVKTDRDGRYTFGWIKEGAWRLTAGSATHVAVQPGTDVEVTTGVESTAPEIVMAAAATVRVRVLTDEGNAVSDKPGTYLSATFKRADGTPVVRNARTDADGYVVFATVPADATEMTLHAAAWATAQPVALSLTGGVERDLGELRLQQVKLPARTK